MHVGGRDGAQQLEGLVDSLLLRELKVLLWHGDDEVHGAVGVVFLVVGDEGGLVLLDGLHQALQEFLVVLGPLAEWELHDLDGPLVNDVDRTGHGEGLSLVRGRIPSHDPLDLAIEPLVPRDHRLHLLAPDVPSDVLRNVPRVVVGNAGAPARADAVRAVQQDQGQHREVPLWLNALPVLVEVLEEPVVLLPEHAPGHGAQPGVDVPWRGTVLATLQPGAKLTAGVEQVDVVRPDKVLGEANDGAGEGLLAVVVRRVLGDVPSELGDLDVTLQVPLEPAVHDLPLAGLEPI